MKLLAIQQVSKNTHMFECAPQNVKKFVPQIFAESQYDTILGNHNGQLFILELIQDPVRLLTTDFHPRSLDILEYSTTQIQYHPLSDCLETEVTESFLR